MGDNSQDLDKTRSVPPRVRTAAVRRIYSNLAPPLSARLLGWLHLVPICYIYPLKVAAFALLAASFLVAPNHIPWFRLSQSAQGLEMRSPPDCRGPICIPFSLTFYPLFAPGSQNTYVRRMLPIGLAENDVRRS